MRYSCSVFKDLCFQFCVAKIKKLQGINQFQYFFHGVVIILAAVERGVLVAELAEQDGIPARGVEGTLNLVIVAFFDVEKMEVLAEHDGLHQLGDGARTACLIKEEDGIGAVLYHLFFLEDDLFTRQFVGGEEIRSHVSHLGAEHGVATVKVGKKFCWIL